MKANDGFSGRRVVFALCAVSVCLFWAFGQRVAGLPGISGPDDLRDELRRAQMESLPSGGDAVLYEAGDYAFAPEGGSASMLSEGIVPVPDSDGNEVREVTLFEDALTRETVFFDAEGREIGSLQPLSDYDPGWVLRLLWPDGAPEGAEEEGYDPSLVVMKARLISDGSDGTKSRGKTVNGAASKDETGGNGGDVSGVVGGEQSDESGDAGSLAGTGAEEASRVLAETSGVSTNAASAVKRGVRAKTRGVVYVDRVNGRDAWTGLVPQAGASDGPKRTVCAGLASARKSRGRLVVRGGAYGEDLNVRGLAVSVKTEGNVVLAAAGTASGSTEETALSAATDASYASATGTVASVSE